MFQLRIEGVVGAKLLLDAKWPSRAVSLLAPKLSRSPEWQPRGEHHRILFFEDIEASYDNWVAPSEEHVLEVLEFTKDLKDGDRLLVNCHMGARRSPAMALGILIQHGMSPEEAYLHVREVRPMASPNGLLTRMIDDHFNLRGELCRIVGVTN